MRKLKFIALIALIGAFASCKKLKDGKVVEDSYTGNVNVTSTGSNPGGDFTGSGDEGTYAFGWENSKSKAEANFDITTPTGSVTLIIEDADGTEVLNKTRSASGEDSYSGTTAAGTPGVWKVSFVFSEFNGDGSYSLTPVD